MNWSLPSKPTPKSKAQPKQKKPLKPKTGLTHAQLVTKAGAWLRKQGCGFTLDDRMNALSTHGETPDAIGFKENSVSLLVECKVTRSDFLADKKKPFRANPELGMGDWRFFMCPPEIIQPEDLPDGWGLIWTNGHRVQHVACVPHNSAWLTAMPFKGNKQAESCMMYSALRRLWIRGRVQEIYEGPPG